MGGNRLFTAELRYLVVIIEPKIAGKRQEPVSVLGLRLRLLGGGRCEKINQSRAKSSPSDGLVYAQRSGWAEKPSPGLAVGKAAPSFRVNDHRGRAVRIGGKAKTWTVLAFFPKAATPG